MEKGKVCHTYILHMLFLACVCITGISLYFCGESIVCSAKTNANKTEEIESFVMSFYKSHTKEGIASLAEYIEDEENLSDYITRYEIALEYGFQKYDNIEIDIYPLYNEEYWAVFVYSDMIVDFMDIGLPGAVSLLVHKGEGESPAIIAEPNTQEIPDEVSTQMRQIALTDEVLSKMTDISTRYNEICEENPEVVQWQLDLSYALMEAKQDALMDEMEAETRTEIFYIVQKGDCLWDIAEDMLGDGMYWKQIYETNRGVIGDNPDLLFVGISLRIEK